MKCKAPNCEVTEETKLQLHHIVPRCIFPKSYKQGKKWDLIIIDGEEKSNRMYLCKDHHEIFSKIDMMIYHSLRYFNKEGTILTEEEEAKLHKIIYEHSFQILDLLI